MHRVTWPQVKAILGTWGASLFLLVICICVGPGWVRDAFSEPSPWHGVRLAIWAVALVSVIGECIRRIRRRELVPVMAQDIPDSDVADAIASGPDQVAAIKTLRRRHPGLGLIDAACLIEHTLQRPDKPGI